MPQDQEYNDKTQGGSNLPGDVRGVRSRPASSSIRPKGKTWFLGIGVNDYQYFSPLNNAVKDVEDVKKLLMKKYELDGRVKLLTDKGATRDQIIEEFDRLVKEIPEEDKLIIYYSGHGHLSAVNGYWIPYDAKKNKTAHYISNSTIRDYIKAIKARHILLISDSCFSGSLFVRGARRAGDHSMDDLEARASRWAICSGRHDEEVYDGEPGSNSPFTESVLDALGDNRYQAFNVAKLADQVVEQTRANYRQLPEGSPLYGVGHKGGQFVFRLKHIESGDWKEKPTQIPSGSEAKASSVSGKRQKRVLPFILSFILLTLAIWLIPEIGPNPKTERSPKSFVFQNQNTQKFGFVNINGDTIEAIYDSIFFFTDSLIQVKKDTNIYYVNNNGICIRDCPLPPPPPVDKDQETWGEALKKGDKAAFQVYLKQFPEGKHAKEARQKLNALVKKEKPIPANPTNTRSETNHEPKEVEEPKPPSFKTARLNGKTWMAENLRLKAEETFTWEDAKAACRQLGANWRLPSDREWRDMAKIFGGADEDASDGGAEAYNALITGGRSGFNAKPDDRYWSSTEERTERAYHYSFRGKRLNRHPFKKSNKYLCRCIKE